MSHDPAHADDPGHDARHNPWTTLSSREVYTNAWITVREDQVVRPDGSPGIYGVVSAKIAAGVVALTAADEVVLVGQYRYPLDRYSWEIVEGGTDHGETSLEAVQRELREEAGYAAARWERLGGNVHLSNSFSDEVAHLYVARDLTPVGRDPDPTEVLAVRHVPFNAALAMVDRGEITDAMSVLALLTLARRWDAGR